MRVVGVCLPTAELPRPVTSRYPVLGTLAQVADVVRALGCDAVAVTSDDATRFNYLRELAWSLEGAGVELLVDPGLVEVAGTADAHPSADRLPAAARRGAALHGLAPDPQAGHRPGDHLGRSGGDLPPAARDRVGRQDRTTAAR